MCVFKQLYCSIRSKIPLLFHIFAQYVGIFSLVYKLSSDKLIELNKSKLIFFFKKQINVYTFIKNLIRSHTLLCIFCNQILRGAKLN